MDLARPYTALSSGLDSEVLHVLAGTNRSLTGREVARLAGRSSHAGVRDTLNRLAEHGLVDRQEAGRALLYTLNREHLAAPAVYIVTAMRTELVRRLRHSIEGWRIAPLHASLFGSAARGDGNTQSDIDILIVRPSDIHDDDPIWREQIDDLSCRIRRWTGNHGSVAELTATELHRLHEQDTPIVANLREDSVLLFGPGVSALFATTP